MLKLGSTKHNVTKRYCEFLALMISQGAVDFGKEVKLYGDRQMQFNVEAYILIRMLEVLEVKSVEFHTEMFRSDEYAVVVRAAHNDILLELEALGVHGNPLVADEEEFMDAILQHVDEEEFMNAILQYVDETGKEITK